ncbi:MAG: GGDEF domain-containing protein [Proteobacteria bacterium]|nr:GGDEF domain-containing protein [Pseudomonadota bacterium]
MLHDALTGVGSRFAYDEQIAQELARSNRYGSTFSYAIFDIDRFKRINDKYGHSAGDKALKIIAQIMRKQIRKTDHIYRVGGEEFAILITNTDLSSAEALVRKIRKAVADSGFHFRQERVELTLSAGITKSQSGGDLRTR